LKINEVPELCPAANKNEVLVLLSGLETKYSENKKGTPDQKNQMYLKCGVGGNRTRVQTYPPKAFYMLIYALVCRDLARGATNQPGPYPFSFSTHSQKP